MIADECVALKGFTAKRTRNMKKLRKKTKYRIGLSGQPVENRPEELFSIMEWIDPEVLGPFPKFDRTFIVRDYFGRPTRYRNLNELSERMTDAMFRRSRKDIAEWLPQLIEMELPVRLDPKTMALHDRIKYDLLQALEDASSSGNNFDILANYGRADKSDAGMKGAVMSRILAMRMVSSHPQLLRISADNFDDAQTKMGSEYAAVLKKEGVLDDLPTSQPQARRPDGDGHGDPGGRPQAQGRDLQLLQAHAGSDGG